MKTASFPALSVLKAWIVLAKLSGKACYTQHLCVSMFGVGVENRQLTPLGRGQQR